MRSAPFFLIPLVVVSLIVLAIWYHYRAKRKRREAMFLFASQNGLQYSQSDPLGLLSSGFELFSRGDGRGCENVIWGSWHGMPLKLADYWYYTESRDSDGGTSRSYSYFSVAITDVHASLPHVMIGRENLFTRLADHLGFRDIEFESEEFNRSFNVKSNDKRFAFELVDAQMMQYLLRIEGRFSFEVKGSSILCFTKRIGPEDLVNLIGTTKLFVERIPRLVWREYGTSPPPPEEMEAR